MFNCLVVHSLIIFCFPNTKSWLTLLSLCRSIEYMIYDNELKEARKKLDKLAEQREEMNTRQSKVTKFTNFFETRVVIDKFNSW